MNEVNETIHEEAEALARESLKREKFSFTEIIRNRTFPELTVPVYVDEASALKLSELNEELDTLDRKVSRTKDQMPSDEQVDLYEDIEVRRAELIEEMNKTKYTARVRGIDDTRRQELMDKAFEDFPPEYEETTLPSGKVEKTEIEVAERGHHYVDLVWQACIVEFTAPDGATSEELSTEDIRTLRGSLPKITRGYLERAIDKVQMSADWYKGLADEVF